MTDPRGETLRRRYFLQETPVFVRAGAIVPGQHTTTRVAPGSYERLLVTAYPGGPGAYELYEDDGWSTRHLDGEHAWIGLEHDATTVRVHPARGRFEGFTSRRHLELRLPGVAPPRAVLAGGSELEWSARPAEDMWAYDGRRAQLVIRLSEVDVTTGVAFGVVPADDIDPALADGLRGLFAGLELVSELVRLVSPVFPMHPEERLAVLLAQAGARISRRPWTFRQEVESMRTDLERLPAAVAGFRDAYAGAARMSEAARDRAVATLNQALAILATTTSRYDHA